jgi:hypothetical protein
VPKHFLGDHGCLRRDTEALKCQNSPTTTMKTCLGCQAKNNDRFKTYQRADLYVVRRKKKIGLFDSLKQFQLCEQCQHCDACTLPFSRKRKLASRDGLQQRLVCQFCVERQRLAQYHENTVKRKIPTASPPPPPAKFRKSGGGKAKYKHDAHYTPEEAMVHLKIFRDLRRTCDATTTVTPFEKEKTTPLPQRTSSTSSSSSSTPSTPTTNATEKEKMILRLVKTFPRPLASQITKLVTESVDGNSCCGTLIPYATLGLISSSQPHTQDTIDRLTDLGQRVKLASHGDSSSATFMNGQVMHASTPAHGGGTCTHDIFQQSHVCTRIAQQRGGITRNAHMAAAIQIPMQSSSGNTEGTFKILPRRWQEYVNNDWAKNRYEKDDVSCTPGETQTFDAWLLHNFFHLSMQYSMEYIFEKEVMSLFVELERRGVAVEHIVAKDLKNDPDVYFDMIGKYPCLSPEQERRFETARKVVGNNKAAPKTKKGYDPISSRADRVTWPCYVNGPKADTVVAVLPTIIRDEDGRLLAVYIPEYVSRRTVENFFEPLGDFYHDPRTLNENSVYQTVGDAFRGERLKRKSVHKYTPLVFGAQNGMTMLGSRSSGSNHDRDGNTLVQSLNLSQFAIHRHLREGGLSNFDEELKAALDPVSEHWRSVFPLNFLCTQYCHRDLPSDRRRGYKRGNVVPSLDSHHVIVSFGPTCSYPSPNHSDRDLGFTFALAGKCFGVYFGRTCTFDCNGEITNVVWDFEKKKRHGRK